MNPFPLLILGFILIFLEFYLPGLVMGILGGLLVLASLFIFAYQSESGLAVSLYVLGTGLGLIALVKYALWRIPRSKSSYSIYSNSDQVGYQASEYDRAAIGKTGVVTSDLKPGGHIMIESKQYPAISQSGYVVKGMHVLVVGGQGDSLIVKPIKKD